METLLVGFVVILAVSADPASYQLPCYKMNHWGPMGNMTTSTGAPVDVEDTTVLDSNLIVNPVFLELFSHMVRERIPERPVHPKGAGAFGYFQVTHNVTDICKAALFSHIGKKTPVVVRFSTSSQDKGETDTLRNPRGFAVKFYTEKGNFDLVALHTPMFALKDPLKFVNLVKVIKRNPVTNLRDSNMLWDFICSNPESAFMFMYLFGDNGIPDGFRYMPGFSIHTYQIYNDCGESFLARFHLMPDLGIKNLLPEAVPKIAAEDPDYAVRDLYNAIELGKFPSWTVSLQVLTFEDAKKAKFDVFDITKVLSPRKYPLRPVGKLVLKKNPTNFFAQMEQLAFCPTNVIPGIRGGADKVFEARRLSYRDAQLYRLGVNFNKILVNCPFSKVYTYERDGVPPIGYNGGDSPNYFPNSFDGPVPSVEKNRPKLINVRHDQSYNFDQAADLYTNEMTEEQRSRMITNILSSLQNVDKSIQEKVVKLFNKIHSDIGHRIAAGLAGNC